tara:strand:- start:30 stop:215 length:186 start_codon:yes stop_codon:yes gene_type:complete
MLKSLELIEQSLLLTILKDLKEVSDIKLIDLNDEYFLEFLKKMLRALFTVFLDRIGVVGLR